MLLHIVKSVVLLCDLLDNEIAYHEIAEPIYRALSDKIKLPLSNAES